MARRVSLQFTKTLWELMHKVVSTGKASSGTLLVHDGQGGLSFQGSSGGHGPSASLCPGEVERRLPVLPANSSSSSPLTRRGLR